MKTPMSHSDSIEQEYDKWFYRQTSKANPSLPMATELIYAICGNDEKKFESAEAMLKRAFFGGWLAARERQA